MFGFDRRLPLSKLVWRALTYSLCEFPEGMLFNEVQSPSARIAVRCKHQCKHFSKLQKLTAKCGPEVEVSEGNGRPK